MRERLGTGVLVALGVIYVVWGSTYLAIKIGLDAFPPFLMAGLRFAVAGVVLYAWAWVRRPAGEPRPGARQWLAATIAGGLLLVGGNGAVTWAEQDIDSGLAALLVASVPLWMALLERLRFGTHLPRVAVAGLLLGFVGVGVLVRPGSADLFPSIVVVLGALAWATGSLYSRGAPLPKRPLLSTAMQMLAGSALFLVMSAASGEFARFDPTALTREAVAAVAYLAVFGSIVAFTAYTWLLRATPSSIVATYAYVNPVVAVLLGWAVRDERLTLRTGAAAAIVVASVALIVTARARSRAAPAVAPEAAVEPARA